MISFENYYQASRAHRNAHKCGGLPYANGDFLQRLVSELQAKTALEIGTAIGYSTYCLASGQDNLKVTTIDLNPAHEEIAKSYWEDLGIINRVEMIIGESQTVLPQLNEHYDILFFDGFDLDPNEVQHYSNLLNDDGVLVTTNITWSKTTPSYFQKLEEVGFKTKEYYDTSISSKNYSSVVSASKAWEDAIASRLD